MTSARSHSHPTVIGIGQCCLDFVGGIDAYPQADTKCECLASAVAGGGPVATALTALARWGVAGAFVSTVGNDALGGLIRGALAVEGIDLTRVLTRPGCVSAFAFVAAEAKTGHRTIFWRRSSGAPPRPDEVSLPDIRHAAAVHTDGVFTEASLRAAETAREAGVPVVVDGGTLRDGLLELAPYTDYFIVSERFAQSLMGADAPEGACERLSSMGPRVAAVTLGDRGFVARVDGRALEAAAYPAAALDTTGCGDLFHAGVTYGIVNGWPAPVSLDFGAWAAARAATCLGGRDGIPSREAVRAWTPRT